MARKSRRLAAALGMATAAFVSIPAALSGTTGTALAVGTPTCPHRGLQMALAKIDEHKIHDGTPNGLIVVCEHVHQVE